MDGQFHFQLFLDSLAEIGHNGSIHSGGVHEIRKTRQNC